MRYSGFVARECGVISALSFLFNGAFTGRGRYRLLTHQGHMISISYWSSATFFDANGLSLNHIVSVEGSMRDDEF